MGDSPNVPTPPGADLAQQETPCVLDTITSPLLKLPAELRNRIYEYALDSHNTTHFIATNVEGEWEERTFRCISDTDDHAAALRYRHGVKAAKTGDYIMRHQRCFAAVMRSRPVNESEAIAFRLQQHTDWRLVGVEGGDDFPSTQELHPAAI